MNWNDWIHLSFLSMHLGALVGTLLFQIWKGIRELMREACDIPLLCGLLRGVLLFYYIPFLILAIRYLKLRYGYWYSVSCLERAAAALCLPETVWLVGAAKRSLAEVRAYRDSRWYMKAGSICCPLHVRAECEELRRRLGIRRKIRYRAKYMQDAAFVQGLLCPVIYLPMEGLDRQEREIVILHELNHIRNRDALWMFLAAALSCICWFLPWSAEVRAELDMWSESCCDLATGREAGGFKIYFDVLIRLVQRSAGGVRPIGMRELCRDKKELYRRVSLIRRHQQLKRRRTSVVAGTWTLFLLVSSILVCASTAFTLAMYQSVYLSTTCVICEGRKKEEITEHTVPLDEFIGEMADFDGIGSVPTAEALVWKMPKGVLGSSSKFRKCSGSTLSIALRIKPADAVIWAGIIDPYGNLHYVSGERVLSHTFSLASAGDYRFFLYNHSSEQIVVVGVCSK